MKNFNKSSLVGCIFMSVVSSFPALAVTGTESVTDEWSKASLVTTYRLNPHLNPFVISVAVENGVATLTGSVESVVERDLAEELALGVEGIRKVNNELTLRPGAPAARSGQTISSTNRDFMSRVNDANLTAKVKSQLLWNNHTSGLAISVKTQNGIVTLSGEVDSVDVAELAENIAENTDDVRSVENNIEVNQDKSLLADLGEKVDTEVKGVGKDITDSWITTKVKSALIYSSAVDSTDINVKTKSGVVSLSGVVDNETERKEAMTIARHIKGVKTVTLNLHTE